MTDAGNSGSSRVASTRGKRAQWHYRPDLPLQVSPLFRLPWRPAAVIKWIVGSWLPISERLVVLGLALASWFFLHPSLERCKDFEPGWIAQIFLRNLGLIFLVAGGLHLYFYILRIQGDEGRHDARPLVKKGRQFTFNNQVLDNMFWSCASGVTVWTAYESLMMWALANGYAPTLSWSDNPVWFVMLILLLPAWESFYFFLVHRLLHWPPLYRLAHSLHHRNNNVGPWSGLSMHPIEHVMYLGTVLIHWVVAAHPLHIIFHLQYFTLTAATTHTGYSGVFVKGKKRLALGTFHHQLHHRYYECNYGGLEVPFDKWFGYFHDGTDESHRQFVNRRRLKNLGSHG